MISIEKFPKRKEIDKYVLKETTHIRIIDFRLYVSTFFLKESIFLIETSKNYYLEEFQVL